MNSNKPDLNDPETLQGLSAAEIIELTNRQTSEHSVTKPTDFAIIVALLLIFPYLLWLCKFNEAYTASLLHQPLAFDYNGIMQRFHYLLQNGNMIVHEAGHGVCYLLPCPQFLTAMNGTNFQLALPLFFMVYYYRKHDKFLVAVGGIWLAQNLVYVAWYMSTAPFPHKYPFFLGNKDSIHDFWYMFGELGVLEYSSLIAGFTRFIAIIMLLGFWGYLIKLSFFPSNPSIKKRIRAAKVKKSESEANTNRRIRW